MTSDEVIADLNERINRAVDELAYTYNPVVQHPQIEGKIRGLQLVADWLRSYPPSESDWEME